MNKKYDYCKIVQDLLPNYIEKSTDEETNKFIEEHINSCEKCNKLYNDLLHSNSEKEKTIAKKEVKYMKKYKNKITILKTALLVILIFFVIYIGRNMIIIGNLQNKVRKYYDSNNYHIEWYSYSPSYTTLVEVYKKDDKTIQRDYISHLEEQNDEEIIAYTTAKGTNVYFVNHKEYGTLEKKIHPSLDIKSLDYIKADSILEFVFQAITSQITTVNCNGKDCYKIDTLGTTRYIEKSTGLTIRVLNEATSFNTHDYSKAESSVGDIFYEFNNVTDEDFLEPDTTGFEKIDIQS